MVSRSRIPSGTVASLVALGLIALYLLAWLGVPLFFDEVALRIQAGRGLIDGFVKLNLFAQCGATPATPFLLLPAHHFFSWMDTNYGWAGIRTLPLLSVFALAVLTLRSAPSRRVAALVLCGGFIGISGLGAAVSRPEYLAYLHAAAILATWMLAQRNPSRGAVIAMLFVHLAIVSLSLFTHMQGLLLMPLSFLACLQLLRREKLLAVITSVLLVMVSLQALAFMRFDCPEDPALAQAIADTQGNGYARSESSNPIKRLVARGWRYESQFLFSEHPEAHWMPIPPSGIGRPLNLPILLLVAVNALMLALFTAIAARNLWREHAPAFKRRQWGVLIGTLALQGRTLWLAAALILIFYSLYDVAGLFYRAHFRNVLTVVLLALALLHTKTLPRPRWVAAWAWLAFATCLASTLIAWTTIAPQLAKGYEGVGVSRTINTVARDEQIRRFTKRCGIADNAERLVVDDATYTALRSHPRPIGFNYIWAAVDLKGEDLTVSPRLERHVRALKPSGYVLRCSALKRWGLVPQRRDGDLCCRRY